MARFLLAPLLLLLTGCVHADLGDPRLRPKSRAFAHPEETDAGRELRPQFEAHPDASGLYVLRSGLDAFVARILMVDAAEKAIDVQYYIFHDDVTGRFLFSRLLAAADRGVRVRLLLDDLGSPGLDRLLAAAQVHPQMEIRLFNAMARGPLPGLARMLDLLSRPRRLNHRMHNKMLTIDGLAAVVGGRNVGDEYFDAAPGVNFADLDLLAFGPVLGELGETFDQYWNAEFVSPIAGWSSLRAEPAALDALRAELLAHEEAQVGTRYAERLGSSTLYQDAKAGKLELLWAPTRAVADLPEKIVARGEALEETLLSKRLGSFFDEVDSELMIVSPYFIPRDSGVEFLANATGRGVRARILTNSLAATDVSAVHAGYKGYRVPMLEAGVELYELKGTGKGVRRAKRSGLFGSSSASLHAKTFLFDREIVFIGSANLDPRSIDLNTEMGLVVHSPELAEEQRAAFERITSPEFSWYLRLDDDGELLWEGSDGGESQTLHQEPGTSWWQRFKVSLLSLLPIQGQL
ncbi:MAG: phospholipase D family protein [Deltaproteobacteria bacterium]|nr:phospholipase D family protein [Deltaproteobacteria bacterium]MBW2393675.1 phospholipase D family protein [Deltaproteobacteria bacterium]